MITEDYVSFEIAKLLKEKGFNPIYCGMYYSIETGKRTTELLTSLVSCPTLQMAMKWLREVHNIFICVLFLEESGGYGYTIENIIKKKYITTSKNSSYKEPEKACEAAIKYCLENLIK